jgi:hypothetical protein
MLFGGNYEEKVRARLASLDPEATTLPYERFSLVTGQLPFLSEPEECCEYASCVQNGQKDHKFHCFLCGHSLKNRFSVVCVEISGPGGRVVTFGTTCARTLLMLQNFWSLYRDLLTKEGEEDLSVNKILPSSAGKSLIPGCKLALHDGDAMFKNIVYEVASVVQHRGKFEVSYADLAVSKEDAEVRSYLQECGAKCSYVKKSPDGLVRSGVPTPPLVSTLQDQSCVFKFQPSAMSLAELLGVIFSTAPTATLLTQPRISCPLQSSSTFFLLELDEKTIRSWVQQEHELVEKVFPARLSAEEHNKQPLSHVALVERATRAAVPGQGLLYLLLLAKEVKGLLPGVEEGARGCANGHASGKLQGVDFEELATRVHVIPGSWCSELTSAAGFVPVSAPAELSAAVFKHKNKHLLNIAGLVDISPEEIADYKEKVGGFLLSERKSSVVGLGTEDGPAASKDKNTIDKDPSYARQGRNSRQKVSADTAAKVKATGDITVRTARYLTRSQGHVKGEYKEVSESSDSASDSSSSDEDGEEDDEDGEDEDEDGEDEDGEDDEKENDISRKRTCPNNNTGGARRRGHLAKKSSEGRPAKYKKQRLVARNSDIVCERTSSDNNAIGYSITNGRVPASQQNIGVEVELTGEKMPLASGYHIKITLPRTQAPLSISLHLA